MIRCVKEFIRERGSRSASSFILLLFKTKHDRFGIESARLYCMLEIRFRARRRVFNLGESGKFPSV